MTLTIGQIVENRYRIDALLGQGGMGAVYRAVDLRINVPVAIKENREAGPDAQKQFAREAGLLAGLRHPHLPRVTDHFFLPDQGQYLVMDYIEGEDLGQVMARRGPIPEAQALAWIGQVLDALEYLHSRSVIHRDVKPANIKLCPAPAAGGVDQVYLVDFGLAKVYDPLSSTTVGARGVTPGYAPPEQYGVGRTDTRSDLYSVGATLYALLTGQAPPDALEHMTGRATFTPPRQLAPALSPDVEAVVLRAMQTRPDDRFQAAAEMWAALAPARPAAAPTRATTGGRPYSGPAGATPPPEVTTGERPRTGRASTPNGPLPAVGMLRNQDLRRRGVPTVALVGAAGVVLVGLIIAIVVALGGVGATPTATVPVEVQVETRAKDGAAMAYVPAGEFLMGSTDADPQADGEEMPQHEVYLDAFWIDQTEVTNAQYRQCVQAGACVLSGCAEDSRFNPDRQPVVCVTWDDAQAYCQWAGARLPTEAEWEKAARGTDGRRYPWGDQWDVRTVKRCNFSDKNEPFAPSDTAADDGYAMTAPVGSYPDGASPYGALDMAGNVEELVADWFDGTYYASSPVRNPTGPDSGQYRGLRGGSYIEPSGIVRSAHRSAGAPDDRSDYTGFRCGVSATSFP
jgi:eukaryotic-like serine/threonine-protein kinase